MKSNKLIATLLATAVALGACGGDDDPSVESATTLVEDEAAYGAQVASYDLAADTPQRFTVGVLGKDGGLVVGGTVVLSFRYLGTGSVEADGEDTPSSTDASTTIPDETVNPISNVVATFTPVADGQDVTSGPKLREGDEGVGVYEATDVDFGAAGFWEVTIDGTIDGETFSIPASFEVGPTALMPAAGDPAPRTVNLLPGDPDAPVKAIDSRAEADGTVPDPELHELTVADAIATGKPTLVVVSTPVFCVSRFCGPITDTAQAMAAEYGDQANFIHIEVWRDFENKALNKGAAEWIYPDPKTDAREPWVFLVDGQGNVAQRWDNVAYGPEMRASLDRLLN